MDPIKYFIYCRSSQRQAKQGQSLDDQRQQLLNYAARKGLTVHHAFHDCASAGQRAARPVFEDMLRRMEHGEANAILTYDLSRLSRNFHESGLIADMLHRGVIKEIRTPKQTFTGAPYFEFMTTLGFMYERALSERIKQGLRVRRLRMQS